MSSPEPSSPPKKKKTGGRPKFNKLKIARKPAAVPTATPEDEPKAEIVAEAPPPADDDDALSFFHRSTQAYYTPHPDEHRAKKREFSTNEDSSSDSEAETSRRQRAQLMRERYQQRQKASEEVEVLPHKKKLGARFRSDSLTPPPELPPSPEPRPRRSTSERKTPTIIPLDSTSEDEASPPRKDWTPSSSFITTSQQDEDQVLATIRAEAQKRRSEKSQTASAEPIIHILITSQIANTKPMIVKRRYDQFLKDVRLTWCRAQGFTPAQQNEVFLVWKNRIRVFDRLSCKGVGVELDPNGEPDGEGVLAGKVHFQAMTEEIFQRAQEAPEDREEEEEEKKKEEPPEDQISVVLKTKGKDEYKLPVRPTTTIASIIEAYRKARNVGAEQTVRLDFEGDTLNPGDTVADCDIDDLTLIDVYIT